MRHDNGMTYDTCLSDEERSLLQQMRRETGRLFAPLDHSLTAPVMEAVKRQDDRRRIRQGFWFSCAPVVAAFLTFSLYLGSFVAIRSAMPPVALVQSSKLAAGSGQKTLDGSCTANLFGVANSMHATAAEGSCQQGATVVLRGDALRRRLLVGWLRTAHSDMADTLKTAVPGQPVQVQLTEQETSELTLLLHLYGFVLRDASHLVVSAPVRMPASADGMVVITFLP